VAEVLAFLAVSRLRMWSRTVMEASRGRFGQLSLDPFASTARMVLTLDML
jgi:hypothetical protein